MQTQSEENCSYYECIFHMHTLRNCPLFQSTTSTQDMDVHQHTKGIKFYSNSSDAIMEH